MALERVHDLVAREHTPGAARQDGEQFELVAGQVAHLSGQAGLARTQVHFEPAKAQHLIFCRVGRGAAQQGLDAGQQFTRFKGLGQVVVGTEFQADDAVHRLAARGEHEQRQASRAWLAAQFTREIQAVAIGQHQVQQQGVEAGLTKQVTPAGQRRRGAHFKAVLAQVAADHFGQAQVVVDEQQVACHVGVVVPSKSPGARGTEAKTRTARHGLPKTAG